jgi:hypothetical protein
MHDHLRWCRAVAIFRRAGSRFTSLSENHCAGAGTVVIDANQVLARRATQIGIDALNIPVGYFRFQPSGFVHGEQTT